MEKIAVVKMSSRQVVQMADGSFLMSTIKTSKEIVLIYIIYILYILVNDFIQTLPIYAIMAQIKTAICHLPSIVTRI